MAVDREAPRPARFQPWDCDPFAQWKGAGPGRAGGDDYPVRANEPGSQGNELPDVASTPHDHRIEATLEVIEPSLDAIRDDVGAAKPEISYDVREKRGSTTARLNQGHLHPALYNLDRYPWQTGARPKVEQRSKRWGQDPEKQQAIEEKMFHDPQCVR